MSHNRSKSAHRDYMRQWRAQKAIESRKRIHQLDILSTYIEELNRRK